MNLEMGLEEYHMMFGSSSGQVRGLSFSCPDYSLNLLLLKIQMPHEEPRAPNQACTAESSKGQEVDPLEVTFEEYQEYLTMFGSSSDEVCDLSFACHYFFR